MSPLLFIIGMEYLSIVLKCASNDPLFKHHPRYKPLRLNHLCFADDLILYFKGDLCSIQVVCKGLDVFAHESGLCANDSKLVIYLAGVSDKL